MSVKAAPPETEASVAASALAPEPEEPTYAFIAAVTTAAGLVSAHVDAATQAGFGVRKRAMKLMSMLPETASYSWILHAGIAHPKVASRASVRVPCAGALKSERSPLNESG